MATRTKLRSDDRREQILAEALRLFLDKGLQHVTTRDIAKVVGISQPSLYAHFKSREEIAFELSERAFAELGERMVQASAASGTAAERLRRMGLEYVRFGLEQSAAYRVAFMLETAKGDMHPIHGPGRRCFAVLHELFIEVRECDDAAAAVQAQSTWASMHGLVALLLARPNFPWAGLETLIDRHLDLVCSRAFDWR